jgi:hypothetical protein
MGVACAYLLVALWVVHPVLSAPDRLLPTSAEPSNLAKLDESLVVSVVIRNADTLMRNPSGLLDYGQCFPLRASHTLGEHMLGAGVLAAIPYFLTGEPILSYNLLLVAKLWIAGMAMFLLTRDLLKRAGPAFVAGLAYQLTPYHLADLVHPYLSGDAFTPLAALFLRRLMIHGGARNMLGLAAAGAMTLLESLYALVSSWIVLGIYAVHLAFRYRATLLRRLVPLAAVAVWLGLVAWIVFAPYLEMRHATDVLRGRGAPIPPLPFVPSLHFEGLLALVALADRVRGRSRDADDPRLAMLLAAVISLWFSSNLGALVGIDVPTAPALLAMVVPGFDAVRAPNLMGQGVWFVLPVLAGYAVLSLSDSLRGRGRALVVAGAACAIFAERALPAVGVVAFGRVFDPAAWDARPDDADIQLLRATHGPTIHVPGTEFAMRAPGHLLLTSFDPRPSAACANSFRSPLGQPMAAFAAALPSPQAAVALHALGFQTVLVHLPELLDWQRDSFEAAAVTNESRAHLVEIGRTERLIGYRLQGTESVGSRFDMLRPARRPIEPVAKLPAVPAGQRATILFWVVNRNRDVFVHPQPILPSPVTVRWLREEVEVSRQQVRAMLPLAVPSRARSYFAVEVEAPEAPGHYRVVLSRTASADTELGSELVDVEPAGDDVERPDKPGASASVGDDDKA